MGCYQGLLARRDEPSTRAVAYVKQGCPFCAQALSLLAADGIEHDVVEVSQDQGKLRELAKLTGDAVDVLTVPKLFIDGTLIRSSEELQDLHARSALRHLAYRHVKPRLGHALPLDAEVQGAVCVLHTGPTHVLWLAELEARLVSRGAKVAFVDVETLQTFNLGSKLPYSVVVNRLSDALPPPLARFAVSFLTYAAAQGLPVINGAAVYSTATSKIVQHALFHTAQLATPQTFVVRNSQDAEIAMPRLGEKVLFKPNAGSFGKGIHEFSHLEDLQKHSQRPGAYGNDGVALLQKYHKVESVHRIFVLENRVQCGVTVAIGEKSTFTGQCMASAQDRRRKDGASAVERFDVPADIVAGCQRLMTAAQADVGSIEYLVDPETQQPLFFDLNLLSTFPSEAVVGQDCWDELAEFILRKTLREESRCSVH